MLRHLHSECECAKKWSPSCSFLFKCIKPEANLWVSQVAPLVKNPPANVGDRQGWISCVRKIPWVEKIPWRRKWQPTPVFLPGESHGQRSLVGYSPQCHKESDTTELTQYTRRSLLDFVLIAVKGRKIKPVGGSQDMRKAWCQVLLKDKTKEKAPRKFTNWSRSLSVPRTTEPRRKPTVSPSLESGPGSCEKVSCAQIETVGA